MARRNISDDSSKRCGRCKVFRPFSWFGIVKGKYRGYCRKCHNAQILTPDLRDKKLCPCCKETKLVIEFNTLGVRYQSVCKECQNERSRKRTAELKSSGNNIKVNRTDYWNRRKWINIKIKYGLSKEQYLQMISDQNNLCAICGKPETETSSPHIDEMCLSVDHDHKTGKVRGLLCRQCNIGIGKLGESAERLREAANYIERHKE